MYVRLCVHARNMCFRAHARACGWVHNKTINFFQLFPRRVETLMGHGLHMFGN